MKKRGSRRTEGRKQSGKMGRIQDASFKDAYHSPSTNCLPDDQEDRMTTSLNRTRASVSILPTHPATLRSSTTFLIAGYLLLHRTCILRPHGPNDSGGTWE